MIVKGKKGFQKLDFETRFWDKVIKGGPDECWTWTGGTASGYGTIYRDGRRVRAPRVSWELANNNQTFPETLLACHTCDNPSCVNPKHIWPGTMQENMQDASRKGRLARPNWVGVTRTHCQRGHAFVPENIRILTTGERMCRACQKLCEARRVERNRLARRALAAREAK